MAEKIPPSEWFIDVPVDFADFPDDPGVYLDDLDPDEREEAARIFAKRAESDRDLKTG